MANGSRHAAYYIAENAYGTTPATPTMAAIRHTTFDLGMDKDTIQSAELRSDRNVSDFRMAQNKCGGPFGMEVLNDPGFEDFIAAVFGGTWSSGVLVNGVLRPSFSILRHFGDLGAGNKPYHLLTGVEFASCDLTLPTSGIATASFETIAKTYTHGESAPASSVLSAPTTTAPMDTFTGTVKEGGSAIGVITEAKIKFDNNMARRFAMGSKDTLLPSQGRFSATGSITAYYESAVMLDKFLNGTSSSLEFELSDGTNTHTILLPNVKYTGGRVPVSDDGPITINLPFQAIYDATTVGAAKWTKNPTT
jgi:hypothetical protein